MKTKLSVNVNKLATLRNSRGKNLPDVAAYAADILSFGAQGITVHPRPDERHIRKSDLVPLQKVVERWRQEKESEYEYNIEGYPSEDFLALVKDLRPHQCTLVPDPPEALTSSAGWSVSANRDMLKLVVAKLREWNVRSSLFVDPAELKGAELLALAEVKPDRIELYTEAYADSFGSLQMTEVLETYKAAALSANQLGIGVNAGHDLNLKNLGTLIEAIPSIEEVSIGHALICEALYLGLDKTIDSYLRILKWRK